MDLQFARSRRRATTRRKLPPKRKPLAWRSGRAAALALVLLSLVAESTSLESSNAKPSPVRRAKAAPAMSVTCPVPQPFRSAFASASVKTGVPLSLLVATAYEESHMNPDAHSGAGATGLLQLMPA